MTFCLPGWSLWSYVNTPLSLCLHSDMQAGGHDWGYFRSLAGKVVTLEIFRMSSVILMTCRVFVFSAVATYLVGFDYPHQMKTTTYILFNGGGTLI